jgi:hypothetical protein
MLTGNVRGVPDSAIREDDLRVAGGRVQVIPKEVRQDSDEFV